MLWLRHQFNYFIAQLFEKTLRKDSGALEDWALIVAIQNWRRESREFQKL